MPCFLSLPRTGLCEGVDIVGMPSRIQRVVGECAGAMDSAVAERMAHMRRNSSLKSVFSEAVGIMWTQNRTAVRLPIVGSAVS